VSIALHSGQVAPATKRFFIFLVIIYRISLAHMLLLYPEYMFGDI